MEKINPTRLVLLCSLFLVLLLCFVQVAARDRTHFMSSNILFNNNAPATPPYKSERDPVVGTMAPVIYAHDVDGQPVSNETFRGKQVRLLLIASCTSCVMSTLTTWDKQTKADKGVVNCVISTGGTADDVRRFVSMNNLHLKILLDDKGATMRAFNAMWMPRAYLIDVQGKIKYVQLPQDDDLTALQKIAQALHQGDQS